MFDKSPECPFLLESKVFKLQLIKLIKSNEHTFILQAQPLINYCSAKNMHKICIQRAKAVNTKTQ